MATTYIYARLSQYDVQLQCKGCQNFFMMNNPFNRVATCHHCGHEQEETGVPDGILREIEHCVEYHGRHLAHTRLSDDVLWDIDSGGHQLGERPSGIRLMNMISKGDHLVVHRLDRGWRSSVDFDTTLHKFLDRGIGIHLVQEGLALHRDAPYALAMARVVASMANLLLDITAKNTRDQKAWAKKHGLSTNGIPPRGWRHQCVPCGRMLPRNKGRQCPGCGAQRTAHNKRLVPDWVERGHMLWILQRRNDGLTFREIAEQFNAKGNRWRGRKLKFQRAHALDRTAREMIDAGEPMKKPEDAG